MTSTTGTILVIDDEKDICELVSLTLEDLGYRVKICLSGEEGLRVVESIGNGIELVLLDLAMPGLSGVDVLGQIKQGHPSLPIIVMSGYVNDVAEVAALGANDILHKPFNLNDVELKVKQCLSA